MRGGVGDFLGLGMGLVLGFFFEPMILFEIPLSSVLIPMVTSWLDLCSSG